MITNTSSPLNIDLLTDYLVWGDRRAINLLEKLTEEEFDRSFNELSGNVRSKTVHILSIYDYFISLVEGTPYQSFPDLNHLTKEELIAKWNEIIITWPKLVRRSPNELIALPLAGNQRVKAEHIFLDAMVHSIHHRGQLLTFIRLLGKDKDEVPPKDTNLDYLNYLFTERKEFIHPAE